MPKKEQKSSMVPVFLKPSIRVLISRGKANKWQGCVYFSTMDRTAEMLALLQTKNGNSTEKYLGTPIYFFTSAVKATVESKISETIHILRSEEEG